MVGLLDSAFSGRGPWHVHSGTGSRHFWLVSVGPVVDFGWVVPRQWLWRAPWVLLPSILVWPCRCLGWGGPSPLLAEGPVGTAHRHSWLVRAAGCGRLGAPSAFLAEGPLGFVSRFSWLAPAAGFGGLVPRPSCAIGSMGVVPHLAWGGPAAGLGGVGGPSPVLAEGPVGAVICHPWRGPAACFGGLVHRQSWQRGLRLLFPATPGWGLLMAVVGWVVPRQSWRSALWVVVPARPGWGPLLPMPGSSLANPDAGPCGCCSPPFLAGACCWL